MADNELKSTNIGTSGTTRGVLTLDRGASTNTPGCIVLEARSGTEYYFWASDNGTIRWHTSLPTADTDGFPVTANSTAQMAQLDNASPSVHTITDADTWYPFLGFEASHTHQSGPRLAVTVGADDYIEVSATGAGTYRFTIEVAVDPATGTNLNIQAGMGINGSDPTEFTATGYRKVSAGAPGFFGRSFIADLANSAKVRLYIKNVTSTADLNIYYAGMVIEYLGD